MIDWILTRAKEKSTWAGILGFITAVGVVLTPEQSEAIIAAVLAIVSAVAIFTKEAK